MSQNTEQRYYEQLHLWVEGVKYFTKTFDVQLEPCEKLVHFSKNLHLVFNKQSIFDPRPENCLSFSKKLPPKIVLTSTV